MREVNVLIFPPTPAHTYDFTEVKLTNRIVMNMLALSISKCTVPSTVLTEQQ